MKLSEPLDQLDPSQKNGKKLAQLGNTKDLANFCPIPLPYVPLKVLTSCLRDAIFNFLAANDYIEHTWSLRNV